MTAELHRWDIFCAVVDNYGDIGVCWRLARQLAAEQGFAVRLWVDDLASLQRLCPEADPAHECQTLRGVEVRQWGEPFPAVESADVVIEAFACELPASYVQAMVRRAQRPAWINLEYLSAESWVDGFHGGASPHPALPLTKYFYFPGFTETSGGLIRERDLGRDFDAAEFWRGHGLAQPQAGETRISLFGYENAGVSGLLQAWAESSAPVNCLLPEGRIAPQVYDWFGKRAAVMQRGNLTVRLLPFLEQDDYDRLLWACDCNFVRGEDSFVRAQWAGKPFVWHIYPQQDDVHWPKLEAFLDRYCAELPPEAAQAVRGFWHAWNSGENTQAGWREFWRNRAALDRHAEAWKAALQAQKNLVEKLVTFCKNRI
jgi:uncharacterized repeat protein (TIGR03837 family)